MTSVILKTTGCTEEENYHVRPGQLLGAEKFVSENMREVYCYIKVLNKIFELGLSMYGVKKELRKQTYRRIEDDYTQHRDHLYHVLNQQGRQFKKWL